MVSLPLPRSGRAVLAVAAGLACVLFFSSCDLLGKDQFPSFLNYAVAKADLAALARSEGLGDSFWVSGAFLTPDAGQGRRALMYVTSYEGSRLFIFDAATMAHLKTVSGAALRSFMAITPTGNYLCGGVEIDAATLNTLSDARPTAGVYDSARVFSDESDLFVLYSDASGLRCDRYDYAWNMLSSASVPPVSGAVPGSYWLLAAYHEPSVSSVVRLIVWTSMGVYSLSFASPSALLAAYGYASLDQAPMEKITLPYLSSDGGWATRDGLISIVHDRDSKLVRYSYSAGTEIDSIRLDSTSGDRLFYFEPGGYYRLMFDGESGMLHLLRTWWK